MPMQEFLFEAKPDLQKARQDWLASLAQERRLSPETVEAYERDSRQFLHFLTGHMAARPGLSDIAALRPADLRGFLALSRGRDGAGARTLGRGLAASALAFALSRTERPCQRRRRVCRCARQDSRNRCRNR